MSTFEKIEKAVVEGYKNIEEGVVEGYKKIEDGVVEGFEKITEGAVEGFKKVDNGKERIAKEQPQVNVNVPKYDHEAAMKTQKERIEKSIEASKNAGRR